MPTVPKKFIWLRITLSALTLLAALLSTAPSAAAAEQVETATTVYTIDVVTGQVRVVVTVKEQNNKPPKTEQVPCQQSRTELYQNYESYQTYEFRYYYYHPGYYYYGFWYPGWNEPIYGWVTHWHYVTRPRIVLYWTTCPHITYFPIYSWSGSIPASATAVSATVNGHVASVSTPSTSTVGGQKYRNVVINSAYIGFGESRTSILRYTIPAGQPRSSALTRINAAYLGICPIGYGTTGGSVEVQIPKPFVVAASNAPWTVADAGIFTRMTQSSNSNMYKFLDCVQASNTSALVTKSAVAGSGKTISIEGWPGDPEWLAAVARYVSKHVTPLERLTGLQLTSAGSGLRVAEASAMLELGRGTYSGRYDLKSNTIWVSEQYDEETVVHELSHVWFNESMPKWMHEGLASWTSKRLLRSGGNSGPFNPLDAGSDWCFLFDFAKKFPKLKTDLGSWGKDSSFVAITPAAESYRYQLSCATVASMLDRLTDDERLRFYRHYASDAAKSGFGSDIEPSSATSELRNVADFVALATDGASPGKIDAWLRDISYGALVGLTGDQALNSANRKPALAAFNLLAGAMRNIGWDGTDAPLGMRKRLADGQYDVNEEVAALQESFNQPLRFFTREEMGASKTRVYVRSLGLADQAVVSNVMRTIRDSGIALDVVGRNWWSNRTPLDQIGAIVLGDPAVLENEALAALAAGDLAALTDKASVASRSAQWAGFTGGFMVLLAGCGAVWVIVRRRNGLALVPPTVSIRLQQFPVVAVGLKSKYLTRSIASFSRYQRRVKNKIAARKVRRK